MSIHIALLVVLFALVVVPSTHTSAHAAPTGTPHTRTNAPGPTPGHEVTGDTCSKGGGDTWVVMVTETGEYGAPPARWKWMGPKEMERYTRKKGWCYRRVNDIPIFEDGEKMGAKECFAVGGNAWHAYFEKLGGGQREVRAFGKNLTSSEYDNYIGRCSYVGDLGAASKEWQETKAQKKKLEKARKTEEKAKQKEDRATKPMDAQRQQFSRKGKEVVRPEGR